MADYDVTLSDVLERISGTVSVTTDDLNDDGEWIRLASDNLSDAELYSAIAKNWGPVAGYINKFALIYCHAGDDPGVWLHYLDTQELRTEYRVGCFTIPTWS